MTHLSGDPAAHPKFEAARNLIGDGLSNAAIGRRLHMERQTVGRMRRHLGIPNVPAQPLTLGQKWAARTRPVDGGHLDWTGERQTVSGTPVLRYWPDTYTAARIAFRIRTGRDPVGYARSECGRKHCVAPAHVDDTAIRQRDREALRLIGGSGQRPAMCIHGHDQTAHGRYEADGRAYCHQCKRERRGKTTGPAPP